MLTILLLIFIIVIFIKIYFLLFMAAVVHQKMIENVYLENKANFHFMTTFFLFQ